VSEEPDQDAPEKMGALVEKYEKKSSRPSRIVGLTGPDVNQVRQMVNQFNQKSVTEGKTEVVEAGDPNGTLFLINPEVRGCDAHLPSACRLMVMGGSDLSDVLCFGAGEACRRLQICSARSRHQRGQTLLVWHCMRAC
jgi:hypothetical protein